MSFTNARAGRSTAAARRRLNRESALASVFLRIAAVAGIGVAAIAPQAAAQAGSCANDIPTDTATCTGDFSSGFLGFVLSPFSSDTVNFKGLTKPITIRPGGTNTAGIDIVRGLSAGTFKVTVDSS